jgi:hypothetical protein
MARAEFEATIRGFLCVVLRGLLMPSNAHVLEVVILMPVFTFH